MTAPKRRDLRDKTIAFYWKGDPQSTYDAMKKDGYAVSVAQIRKVSSYENFSEMLAKTLSRSAGVMSRIELQEFLTAVVRGEVPDGKEFISFREEIMEWEDDYDSEKAGRQWRKGVKPIDRDASLAARLKASALLGSTIGAFEEKHIHEHNHQFKISDLLDDDLKEKTLDSTSVHVRSVPSIPVALLDEPDFLQ